MSDAAIPIGSFAVRAASEEVAAFRIATSAGDEKHEGADLPLTFPMRWLVAPDVRTALIAMISDPDLILVHEAQTFEYIAALHVGETYRLELTGARQHAPDRLVIKGTIQDGDGAVQARLETILRLFSTKAVAA